MKPTDHFPVASKAASKFPATAPLDFPSPGTYASNAFRVTGEPAFDHSFRLPAPAVAWHGTGENTANVEMAGAFTAEWDALALETETTLYLFLKRVLDICGAVLALLVLSPLLLLVSLCVKLSDGGPVLYVHRRVGLRGREFTCYKFRTMRVDAERLQEQLEHMNSHSDPRTFKIPNDPRVTWVGRWLRCTSIDEMPQFWNVLRGEMSLVGPRPPVPKEVAMYSARDMRRLDAKPGLTCIWQVSGRSRLPFPQQLEMDIEYIRKRSLWFDVKLIALTIPAVLRADGAC